jgi:hypothetical protein
MSRQHRFKKNTQVDTKTTKWTQGVFQQTPKWNSGDYFLKETYKIKKTTQDMKEEYNKDMENLKKKFKQKSWK